MAFNSLLSRLSFLFVKNIVLAPSWWRGKSCFAKPLAPPAKDSLHSSRSSRTFGAQYLCSALVAYFSQTKTTFNSLLSRLSFLFVKNIVLAPSWWRGGRFCFAKPLAPLAKGSLRSSRAFGAQYLCFALVAYFSQTVLNRVFDKD